MIEKNVVDFKNSFSELEPELKDKLREWHGDNAEHFFELFRTGGGAYGIGHFDLRPALAKVQCPSLVIYPDRSSIFDVDQGISFYKHLQRGELAVLPSCGHSTYEYRPEDYLRHVLDFFERHDPSKKASNPDDDGIGSSCLAVKR